jgi:TctA family transporter
VENSTFDVGVTVAMALLGVLLIWLECPPAPLALGFVLGPMMEEYFRRALALSSGNLGIFVTSPPSVIFLLITTVLAISLLLPAFSKVRETAFAEEEL